MSHLDIAGCAGACMMISLVRAGSDDDTPYPPDLSVRCGHPPILVKCLTHRILLFQNQEGVGGTEIPIFRNSPSIIGYYLLFNQKNISKVWIWVISDLGQNVENGSKW